MTLTLTLFRSRNYFAKHWSLRGGARRLKNVVMFLDWVPHEDKLLEDTATHALSPDQQVRPPPPLPGFPAGDLRVQVHCVVRGPCHPP
jgi:hypothetical protein